MDSEKLFNLQLTIQKLEEELTLYRNGTTSSDLIEIISEKDEEILSLKNTLNEKNEMLSKFHRGTIEVLKQNEILTNNLNEKTVSLENAMKEIEILNEIFTNLQNETNEKISNLEKLSSQQQNEIDDLNETVVRLQQQCANVVKEKQELHKKYDLEKEDWEELKEKDEAEISSLKLESSQLKEEFQQMESQYQSNLLRTQHELQQTQQDYQNIFHQLTTSQEENQRYSQDLEESQKAIQEAKVMITKAQKENEHAVMTFHDRDRENKVIIARLEEQVSDVRKELEDIQKLHVIRIEEKNQREREFQQMLLTKDDRIREVTYELDVAKRACEELIRQNHKSLQDRESHWQGEYEKLERALENTNQKLKRAETERDRTLSDRREHDILKAKYATLEDKIKRQEAYMKSRFLKDKSNTLHVPDALFKSTTAGAGGTGTGAGAGERLSTGGSGLSSRSTRSNSGHISSSSSFHSSSSSSSVMGGVGPNQTMPTAQKNHEI